MNSRKVRILQRPVVLLALLIPGCASTLRRPEPPLEQRDPSPDPSPAASDIKLWPVEKQHAFARYIEEEWAKAAAYLNSTETETRDRGLQIASEACGQIARFEEKLTDEGAARSVRLIRIDLDERRPSLTADPKGHFEGIGEEILAKMRVSQRDGRHEDTVTLYEEDLRLLADRMDAVDEAGLVDAATRLLERGEPIATASYAVLDPDALPEAPRPAGWPPGRQERYVDEKEQEWEQFLSDLERAGPPLTGHLVDRFFRLSWQANREKTEIMTSALQDRLAELRVEIDSHLSRMRAELVRSIEERATRTLGDMRSSLEAGKPLHSLDLEARYMNVHIRRLSRLGQSPAVRADQLRAESDALAARALALLRLQSYQLEIRQVACQVESPPERGRPVKDGWAIIKNPTETPPVTPSPEGWSPPERMLHAGDEIQGKYQVFVVGFLRDHVVLEVRGGHRFEVPVDSAKGPP